MSYKCRVCNANDVNNSGDVCELCALAPDPYASALNNSRSNNPPVNHASSQSAYPGNPGQGGGQSAYPGNPGRIGGRSRKVLLNGGMTNTDPYGNDIANTDPYGNDMTPQAPANNVQVFQAGQVPAPSSSSYSVTPSAQAPAPAASTQPLTVGIIKNVTADIIPKSYLAKWARAVFSGIPFTFDNDVTSFQVFPDYSGTSVNASGNSCDQVIIYGKVTAGTVSENNDVEVYGKRDSNNNIIAKTIRNIASGTTVSAMRTIPANVIRTVTFVLLGSLFAIIAASMGGSTRAGSPHTGAFFLILLLAVSGFLLLKLSPRLGKFASICFAGAAIVACFTFFPGIWSQLIGLVITIGIIYFLIKFVFKR